jgi:DNA-binding GntR family transcriptional regulator
MAAGRERLEHRVYKHLLGQMSTRQLELGTHLKAGKLAMNLKVSRTTVRKALSRLVDDGWVEQTPSGYTYVAQSPDHAPCSVEMALDDQSQIESTYWLIFDWILQGNCRGGEDVIPRLFADQFSVSMGTVRHALDWLTRDGLLVRVPRRGWRFRSLIWQDVIDTIEIRTMLESEVLRRAGARIPHSALVRLKSETESVLENIDSLPERDRRHADYVFHTTLVEQSASSVLIDVVKPLIRRSMFVGINCPPEKRHKARSFREHLGILEELLRGSELAAVELLQAHFRRVLKETIPPLARSSFSIESTSLIQSPTT